MFTEALDALIRAFAGISECMVLISNPIPAPHSPPLSSLLHSPTIFLISFVLVRNKQQLIMKMPLGRPLDEDRTFMTSEHTLRSTGYNKQLL